jgi:hypothetical protein
MMLAILQGASEVDASQTWTRRLSLKSLGVAPGAVLSALDASGDPGNRNMARTIEALLRRHGLEDLVALN